MAAWRAAYQAFGAKPKRTRPSVEALLRRVEAGLPRIDRITDIYNAISVRHLLPVGGEDLTRYRGSARLARAAGDEPFDTVREGEPVTGHPEPGEVIWRDDDGVTCRCWNWRQCVRFPDHARHHQRHVDPRRPGQTRSGRPRGGRAGPGRPAGGAPSGCPAQPAPDRQLIELPQPLTAGEEPGLSGPEPLTAGKEPGLSGAWAADLAEEHRQAGRGIDDREQERPVHHHL